MEKLDLKKFRKLKGLEGLLCLDWFGGISVNPYEPDNPLIECYFTPIIIKYNGQSYDVSREYLNQICILLPVGFLPVLSIGQIYKNGICEFSIECGKTEIITFEFDQSVSSSTIETTLSKARLSNKSKLVKNGYERTRENAGAKILIGKASKSNRKEIKEELKKYNFLPIEILIHEVELIRFYYTNSPFLSKMVFSEHFQGNNLYKHVINAIHELPAFDTKTKHGRFVYRFGFSQNDAPILGRIIFEPKDRALNAVRRIHNSIIADRILEYPNPTYTRTNFPFEGKTSLEIIGRRILREEANKFYFLAYQILSCSAQFPFKSLSYCNEVSPGGKPAPENAPEAFSGANTIFRGPANSNAKIGESVGDERPKSGSEKIVTHLPSRKFGGLRDVKLIYEKLKDCTHVSKRRHREYLECLINASTGMGIGSHSSAVKQDFHVPLVSPPESSVDLGHFIRVINGIRYKRKNWICKTILVVDGFTENGESYSFFPEVECDIWKANHQFSYMNRGKTVRRQFLCVEFNIDGKYMYIFEAQRRLKDNKSKKDLSDYKEALPILLLYLRSYKQCIGKDFTEFLIQTVKNKRWSSNERNSPDKKPLEGFVRNDTLHSLRDNAEADMINRIIELVQRNIPEH